MYESVVVPTAMPVTSPVVGFTVAVPVVLVDHVPPAILLIINRTSPSQNPG